MLWDLDYPVLFVIWAIAVASEPEQGTEPGLCCMRLKELKEQPLSQTESKSWGFLPDLTCSKAAAAALCHSPASSFRQRCLRRGRRSGVFFLLSRCSMTGEALQSYHSFSAPCSHTFFPSWFSLLALNLLDFSFSLFFSLISLRNFPHVVICSSHLCLVAVLFPELQVVCMVVSPVMFLSGILQ